MPISVQRLEWLSADNHGYSLKIKPYSTKLSCIGFSSIAMMFRQNVNRTNCDSSRKMRSSDLVHNTQSVLIYAFWLSQFPSTVNHREL